MQLGKANTIATSYYILMTAQTYYSPSIFLISLLFLAPACMDASFSSLITARVGMLVILKAAASSACSSTFILTTLASPLTSSLSWSIIGPTILQGPHQGAQKSSSTGRSDFITSLSKLSIVTFIAAISISPLALFNILYIFKLKFCNQ